MSTLSTVLAYSRAQAQTDSNGLTDTNGIIFANEALVDFHRKLVNKGVDASQLQEAYANTTINQGTYLYPTDMLALKAIELNYGSSSSSDYVKAEQVDVSNISGNNSFSWLRLNANANYPKFDDRGDWYEIFPTPQAGSNTNQAIRLFYYLKPTEYTTTSDTVAYPESQDYRILGWRIAANYYYSLNKMDEGDRFNLKYEERVTEYCATLGRGSSQPLEAKPINWSGWEF